MIVLFSHPLISGNLTQPEAEGQESLWMLIRVASLRDKEGGRRVASGVRGRGWGAECVPTMPVGAGSQLSAACPSPALSCLSKDISSMKSPLFKPICILVAPFFIVGNSCLLMLSPSVDSFNTQG